MIHRHLDYPPDTPLSELGDAALDDLLDRDDLGSWRTFAKEIVEDPFGDLADRVLRLCDAHPRYGTSPLWRAWIARRRALAAPRNTRTLTLAQLRRLRGMSQTKLAAKIGMTQSDLSKAERRADWKLSTLEAIARGLGLRASVVFEDELGRPAGVIASDSRQRDAGQPDRSPPVSDTGGGRYRISPS